MNILLTGASGFIGQALQRELGQSHQLYLHFRRDPRPSEVHAGTPIRQVDDIPTALDAVVNLAGENLGAQRWTNSRKQALRDSRIAFTQKLSADLAAASQAPKVWINGSAVGIYGDAPGRNLDESSALGDDFAAQLCRDWEATAEQAAATLGSQRLVLLRLGVVLGPGGALQKMLPPFRFGLGAVIGPGEQHMPWVSRDDVVQVIRRCLEDEAFQGPFNLSAPETASQRHFAKTLGQVLRRPVLFTAPAPLLKLMLGEMSSILLVDQQVMPVALANAGYRFRHPDLASALEAALS